MSLFMRFRLFWLSCIYEPPSSLFSQSNRQLIKFSAEITGIAAADIAHDFVSLMVSGKGDSVHNEL